MIRPSKSPRPPFRTRRWLPIRLSGVTLSALILFIAPDLSSQEVNPDDPPPTPTEGSTEPLTGLQRFQLLENRYREKLAEVHAPLIASYLSKLNALKASYVRDGKEAEAAQIDSEIAWLKSKPWESGYPDPSDLLPSSGSR